MNIELFLEVMVHFIKHTISSKEYPTLLIFDNYEAHLSDAALNLAKANGHLLLVLLLPLQRITIRKSQRFQPPIRQKLLALFLPVLQMNFKVLHSLKGIRKLVFERADENNDAQEKA